MKYYTIQEAAKVLNVKERTVRLWLHDGRLKGSKYNRSKRWYISDKEISRKKAELES